MRRGLSKTFLVNTMLRSPVFLALPATVRGWWLGLQSLCSSQENGGRIAGAAGWSNAAWQAALGAGGSKRVIEQLVQFNLAAIDGEDVVAAGYDTDSEAQYQAKRTSGRKGGQASAAARLGAAGDNDNGLPVPESTEIQDNDPSTAQAAFQQPSSAQGEGGEARKGEAEVRIARGGGEPESAGVRSPAPARAQPGGAPAISPAIRPRQETDAPRSLSPSNPQNSLGRDRPDPLGALANCIRARAGSSATESEKRSLREFCASLANDQAVEGLSQRLWTYWKERTRPSVSVTDFLAIERKRLVPNRSDRP